MIHAKNYKTVTKFDKVMPRILWPLFFLDTVYILTYLQNVDIVSISRYRIEIEIMISSPHYAPPRKTGSLQSTYSSLCTLYDRVCCCCLCYNTNLVIFMSQKNSKDAGDVVAVDKAKKRRTIRVEKQQQQQQHADIHGSARDLKSADGAKVSWWGTGKMRMQSPQVA